MLAVMEALRLIGGKIVIPLYRCNIYPFGAGWLVDVVIVWVGGVDVSTSVAELHCMHGIP